MVELVPLEGCGWFGSLARREPRPASAGTACVLYVFLGRFQRVLARRFARSVRRRDNTPGTKPLLPRRVGRE
jgi:hypothetical protein